jgi:hypothetical protein
MSQLPNNNHTAAFCSKDTGNFEHINLALWFNHVLLNQYYEHYF